MSENPFTDEQYKSEYRRIMNDERYSPAIKAWGIEEITKMYRERNNGQEPPEVTAVQEESCDSND